MSIEQASHYSAEDADVTLRVHLRWPAAGGRPQLDKLYRDIELPVAEALYRMERNGVLIDARC